VVEIAGDELVERAKALEEPGSEPALRLELIGGGA
jgi:hypothetical protein